MEEVVRALKQMKDGKVMGPNELPSEFRKLALRGDRGILAALHELVLSVWIEEVLLQTWKYVVIKVLCKKKRLHGIR